MINLKKLFFVVLFSVSFSVFAEQQQTALSYHLTPMAKSVAASDFTLLNMDGEKRKLSHYRDTVILLNFWATWCPPCVREMPSMERLQQSFDTNDFKVIAINQMEDVAQVVAFIDYLDTELTFEILFDNKSKVSQAYAVRGLPTSYLIDKQGNVRYRAVGERDFKHPEVLKIINALIKE